MNAPTSRIRYASWVAIAAAVGIALLPALPAAATATDPDEAITWAVSPADASGPDGRSWVEQELDPGESREEHLAIRNLGATEVTFSLAAADGYFTDNGRFNILPASQQSSDAGLWIEIQESVTVPAGGMVVVPYTIAVPPSAIPGDHAAGVAASVRSIGTQGGASVGIESRVGFRVMTRVEGALEPSLALAGSSAGYRLNWNPFAPGGVNLAFDVKNTGNTRLRVAGTVTAAGSSAEYGAADEAIELLPGDSREIELSLSEIWPLVVVPIDIEATAEVADAGGDWQPGSATAQQLTVLAWAVPLPQLASLAGVACLVVALSLRRRHERAATARLVADARAQGRDEGRRDALPD